jgi:hypothetical protein
VVDAGSDRRCARIGFVRVLDLDPTGVAFCGAVSSSDLAYCWKELS